MESHTDGQANGLVGKGLAAKAEGLSSIPRRASSNYSLTSTRVSWYVHTPTHIQIISVIKIKLYCWKEAECYFKKYLLIPKKPKRFNIQWVQNTGYKATSTA